MRNLILLTNAFPYGKWEPYLETEISYYEGFDNIHICSLQIRREQLQDVRKLPSEKFQVYPILKAAGYIYLLYAIVAFVDKNFYKEIKYLFQQKRITVRRLLRLLIYMSRSHYEARKIVKYLKKSNLYDSDEKGIIYAYRFDYQPYVGLLIQKHLPNYKVVARGHGYDLYEERNGESYLPLREVLLQGLDSVIMISDVGKAYLEEKYPQYASKIVVSRLGTKDYSVKEVDSPNGMIRIVSCSNVIPLKRIDRIIKSLQLIADVEVYWTHYGDGPLLEEIKSQCSKLLGDNIHYDFRGNIANEELLKEYSEKGYHLFLNVSEYEGVPVSIMEAMSFGIPCIATDVGGTKEILTDGHCGILLEKEFAVEELTKWINCFAFMKEEDYQIFRKNARTDWERKCSADQNYRRFNKWLTEWDVIHEK